MPEMKTWNGYEIVDAKAREEIENLNIENGEGTYSIKTKVPKGISGGNVVLGKGSSAFGGYLIESGEYNFDQGYNNEVHGNNNAVFGYNNKILEGNTNTIFGYMNKVEKSEDTTGKVYGSVNCVSGWNNNVFGDYNVVLGRDNIIGSLTSPWVTCILLGRGHDPRKSGQILFGNYSKAWGGVNFAIGNGTSSTRSNSFDINQDARARSYPNEKALSAEPNDNDILIRKEIKELSSKFKHKLEVRYGVDGSATLYLISNTCLDTNEKITYSIFKQIVDYSNENFIALYGANGSVYTITAAQIN